MIFMKHMGSGTFASCLDSQEQPLLLRQMIAGGLDARIVKVLQHGGENRIVRFAQGT